MLGDLRRVKTVNMEAYLHWNSSSMMLFSVNHETWKLITMIHDLPYLIAVNCAHTPSPPAPLRPSWLISHQCWSRKRRVSKYGKQVLFNRKAMKPPYSVGYCYQSFIHLTEVNFQPGFLFRNRGFPLQTAWLRLVPLTGNSCILPLQFTRANVQMISGSTVHIHVPFLPETSESKNVY